MWLEVLPPAATRSVDLTDLRARRFERRKDRREFDRLIATTRGGDILLLLVRRASFLAFGFTLRTRVTVFDLAVLGVADLAVESLNGLVLAEVSLTTARLLRVTEASLFLALELLALEPLAWRFFALEPLALVPLARVLLELASRRLAARRSGVCIAASEVDDVPSRSPKTFDSTLQPPASNTPTIAAPTQLPRMTLAKPIPLPHNTQKHSCLDGYSGLVNEV